ncbi:hypothetical protein [Candidatus Poriferisodalis sp.]|uniref:hypothetical protein n=1 Tax=Candidatus Poriferisodalis sp. TaxID=3101277 RepID=UPI003B01F601
MWDLAHAVWQFAPVCDDADRWLGGWPSPPDRSARIAALVGGCRLGPERAIRVEDGLAAVREWEQEHGELSTEELAWADKVIASDLRA